MKKKVFRERYNEGLVIINKGIDFTVDPIEEHPVVMIKEPEVKIEVKKRGRKKSVK